MEKKNGKNDTTPVRLWTRSNPTAVPARHHPLFTLDSLPALRWASRTSSRSLETHAMLPLHMHTASSVLYRNSSPNPSLTQQWHHSQKTPLGQVSLSSLQLLQRDPLLREETALPALPGQDVTHTLWGSPAVTRQSPRQKAASSSAARSE